MENKKFELWNPKTIANLSIFLSVVFGAYFIKKNWDNLNEKEKAKNSKIWLWIGTFVYLVGLFIVPNPLVLHFFLLIIWYFFSHKKQSKYIRENLNNNYVKNQYLNLLPYSYL